jgi:hypothetical protein
VIVTVLMVLAIWRFLRGDVQSRGASPVAEPEGLEPAPPIGAAQS